jgi:hypothetical protein
MGRHRCDATHWASGSQGRVGVPDHEEARRTEAENGNRATGFAN